MYTLIWPNYYLKECVTSVVFLYAYVNTRTTQSRTMNVLKIGRALYLLWITVLSDTLYSTMFRSSTSNRQVYFPPSLTPTSLIFSGPSLSLGFCGSGFRKVSNKTLSLSHEILFNGVEAMFPLSVTLQISVTLSSCSKTLESETTTLGISLPKKAATKNTQLYTNKTKRL